MIYVSEFVEENEVVMPSARNSQVRDSKVSAWLLDHVLSMFSNMCNLSMSRCFLALFGYRKFFFFVVGRGDLTKSALITSEPVQQSLQFWPCSNIDYSYEILWKAWLTRVCRLQVTSQTVGTELVCIGTTGVITGLTARTVIWTRQTVSCTVLY